MRSVHIEEITIDEQNRLLVRPELMPTENFAHIYRDASGVAWLENGRSLGASGNVWPTITPWAMIDSGEQVESTLGKRVGRRQRARPPKHVDAPR